MGKLSTLLQETTIALTDFVIKVKSGGAGDTIITVQNFINFISANLPNGSVTPTMLASHAKVGTFSTPAATGNFSVTGVGFKPQLVRFTMLEVTQATDSVNSVGAMTATSQFTNATHVSSGSFNSYSSSSNCLAYTPFNSDVPATLASFVSMDTDGFTVHFSAVGGGTFAWEAIA